jgi:hypothetical protein
MKRRQFIKSSTVFAVPSIVPASVLGEGDKVAPSNRITLGLIGCGRRGTGDMKNMMNEAEKLLKTVNYRGDWKVL